MALPTTGGIDLTSLIGLFTGKSGSSSQSSTTASNISKEGMDRLVQQILESDQGVASILTNPKRAGIYNSSTAQQLLGDFAARTAGELAAKQAGTSTTQLGRQDADPSLNFGKVAGGLALTSLLGPTVGRGMESVGITGGLGGVGKSLADLIFGATGDVGYNPATVELPSELRGDNGYVEASVVDMGSDMFPEEDYSWLIGGDDTGDIWGD